MRNDRSGGSITRIELDDVLGSDLDSLVYIFKVKSSAKSFNLQKS